MSHLPAIWDDLRHEANRLRVSLVGADTTRRRARLERALLRLERLMYAAALDVVERRCRGM